MQHLNQDLKQSKLYMHVRKYNGHSEPYNPEKIKGWLVYALKGSIPEAEVDTIVSSLPVHEGITTSEIQLKLVNACTNKAITLASNHDLSHSNHDLSAAEAFLEAARVLYLTIVHKTFHKAFPQLETYTTQDTGLDCGVKVRDYLLPVVEFGIAEGLYEQSLLDAANYFADCKVYPSRDNLLPACGLTQLATKYFRTVEYGSELIYRETPTVMYGLMALSAAWALVEESTPDCANKGFAMPAHTVEHKELFQMIYDNLSQGKNNSPTPMTIGLRTPQEEYASCVLAECPDTMDGIDTMYDIVSKATSARAGLGIQPSAIRPMLAPVKGGSLKHTGLVKFIQAWMRITKATVQNSARGGSATFNISYWHRNYFDLVMLNDPDGEEAVRCKEADYAFHHDGYLMQAALDDRYVALLDPNTNMGNGLTAYETYYSNIDYFYQWVWENVDSLPDISEAAPYENCKVKAYDVLARLALQIFKTGNNYQFFTDNVNEHTPYEEPIKMTNLCCEVLEPTHPAEVGDPFSEVALCTLGGIPWGFVTDEEIPKVTKGQLLLLAAVFEKSRTKIPFTSAAYLRRSVGVGAIDVHHYLAKFNLDLTDGSKENLLRVGKIVHDRMELIQFHLIKAAAELARQYTPADYRTKWKKGWLPIDTYKRHELTNHPLNQDWEGLRQYVIESGGLYFSALSAHMPSESSSVIWGFVNGIEPPRDLITDKSSKVLSVLVPVPELATLKYTMAYDVHPDIQLVIAANIQKFSCQGISYNTYIDYSKKPTFTMEEAMDRLFYRPWALGLKTMYYTNFNIENDGERIEIKKEACESGACTI